LRKSAEEFILLGWNGDFSTGARPISIFARRAKGIDEVGMLPKKQFLPARENLKAQGDYYKVPTL
jgi:hypothetical protein